MPMFNMSYIYSFKIIMLVSHIVSFVIKKKYKFIIFIVIVLEYFLHFVRKFVDPRFMQLF